jgi:hypothetical protein
MLSLLLLTLSAAAPLPKADLLESRLIWDAAPHSAFTDMVFHNGKFWCVFREGEKHVSKDGAIRIITSTDGKEWAPAAELTSETMDLRDPKIVITPQKELAIYAAGALHDKEKQSHQSLVWFSKNGTEWGEPTSIGDPDYWLWRVQWHGDTALGVGYPTDKKQKAIRIYESKEGKTFTPLVAESFAKDQPNETAIHFDSKGTGHILLRRDGGKATAQWGTAKAPYTDWKWQDTGTKIGGPALVEVPGIGLIAVVRLYDKKVRTAVCSVDPETGKLTELLALPSGGDTSYAGPVWHDNQLWISYYSSHEKKTAIYLAKVRLTAGK